MLTISNLALSFNGQNLFQDVNLLFRAGNCYGVIGANGAGKSTFLKILSGQLEPSKGEVALDPKVRMSVLGQDHYAYEEFTVLETILQGNPASTRCSSKRTPSTKSPISARKTATWPLNWRPSLPSWTAGTPRPTRASCSRAWG